MVKPLVALCLAVAAGCACCEPITFRLAQKQVLSEHSRLWSWQAVKGLRLPSPAGPQQAAVPARLPGQASRMAAGAAARHPAVKGEQRRLLQSPAPVPGLLSALSSISGDFAAAAPSANASSPAGPSSSGQAAGSSPGPGPCTDPSLLSNTMSTFCKVTSVDQLASLRRDAVQACCQLTSATLQKGCWNACSPPPAVSQDVLTVLKLWRTICLINTPVSCDEQGVAAQSSGR